MKFTKYALATLLSCNFLQGAVIATQDFDLSTGWTPIYSPELDSFSSVNDAWTIRSVINGFSVGSGDFLATRDIENNDNPSGSATIELGLVDTSNYENVSISFDYGTSGFDVGDNVVYTVVIDGVDQTPITLVEGSSVSGGVTVDSTESITIAGTPSTVGLKVTITQNGSSDYSGLDNFVLEGDLITVPEPSTALLSALGLLGLVRRKR